MLYIIIILISLIFLYYLLRSKNIIESYNKIPSILHKTGPYDEPTYELQNIFFYNKKRLNLNNLYYYNDKDCKNLVDSIDYRISQAYDSLIPTAYKADIWRYCVLYKYGGVYGDMTQRFFKEYNVNDHNVDMVLVRDIDDDAIQISFIATKPNSNFFKYLLNNITTDVLDKKKGNNSLDVTGPYAFCRYFKLFFNLDKIPEGINNIKGLDNNYYKIRIDLRQYKGLVFRDIKTQKIIASTKIRSHNNDLYNVTKIPKYTHLWQDNIIFK